MEYFYGQSRQREANRKNLVLVKKKPDVQTYADILHAIQIGASRPGMIVMSTGISWITVMQCLRTLEQKGLISTGFDAADGKNSFETDRRWIQGS